MQVRIEGLNEKELTQKLLVAAQVCTHSVAVNIHKQPRQQFYQHPPSTPQQPLTSPSQLSGGTIPDAAVSASRSASASIGPRSITGAMVPDQPDEAVPEKAPFKKGRWAGGRQVEGLLNRGPRQTVDDGPSASGTDRAQGYRRMRAPSQVGTSSAGIPVDRPLPGQLLWDSALIRPASGRIYLTCVSAVCFEYISGSSR